MEEGLREILSAMTAYAFRFRLGALLTCFLLPTSPALARTWLVSGEDGGGGPSLKFVQAAIDSSTSGDVIVVSPGTYFENIDFMGKDIVLRSELGPAMTILDGSRRDSSVVVFRRQESRAAVLDGFTITGGVGSRSGGIGRRHGGGIYCIDASPTIRNSRIVGNTVDTGWGAGMIAALIGDRPPGPLIENNQFEENFGAWLGGGLQVSSSAEVIGNLFRQNVAIADGGGLDLYLDGGTVLVKDNQFWDNQAGDHGGGIEAYHGPTGGPIIIDGNLFVRNVAWGEHSTGGVDAGSGGAMSIRHVRGEIINNTLVDNHGLGNWSCMGGGILLDFLNRGTLTVSRNIIVGSVGCGIACYRGSGVTVPPIIETNLFWDNTPGELGIDNRFCLDSWVGENYFTDPIFCAREADNYTVSAGSLAITSPGAPLGVFQSPGCNIEVPVSPTTWGQLKARYR